MIGPARLHHLIAHGQDVIVFCENRRCRHSAKLPVTVFLAQGATHRTPVPALKRWLRCIAAAVERRKRGRILIRTA
jgi:hypothetical protein